MCEPRFTGLREICELCKNVNLKSKFTEKSCEPGSHKFGTQVMWIFLSFTFFQSSHISRKPVNLGSHIIQAPKIIFYLKRK